MDGAEQTSKSQQIESTMVEMVPYAPSLFYHGAQNAKTTPAFPSLRISFFTYHSSIRSSPQTSKHLLFLCAPTYLPHPFLLHTCDINNAGMPPSLPLDHLLSSTDHADFSARRQLSDISIAIAKARRIVTVSGAGISCSSGIPVNPTLFCSSCLVGKPPPPRPLERCLLTIFFWFGLIYTGFPF